MRCGVLLALGAGLLGFGLWGTRTAAGRRAFDEMAGMVPLAALALGAVLLLVGAALWWWRRRPGA